MISKAELRRAVREKFDLIAPADLAEKSARVCEAIASRPEWRQARTVCLFAPHSHEPAVDSLWRHIGDKQLCYPRVADSRLDLLFVRDLSELKTSRWNLREPDYAPDNLVSLENIDVLLVPGVAFSHDGGRLGRGGGFYDRLLAEPRLRAWKIGVCLDAQLVAEVPSEAHDRKVDAVITEGGVVRSDRD